MKKFIYLILSLMLVIPTFVYAIEPDETEKQVEVKEENQVEEKETIKEEVIYVMTDDSKSAKFRKSNNELINIKLLGINVPEKSEQATTALIKSTLEKADKIVLEYDNLIETTDSYGRTYAWVFVDDVLLQELLVEEGYVSTSSEVVEYKYMKKLEEAKNEAKNKEIGIWEKEEEEEEIEEEKPAKKNFFQKMLASIGDFFDQILENILKMIDNML